jgi:hypothetical protein
MRDARLEKIIKNGIKGEMPSFGKKFNDADVQALIAWLRTLKAQRLFGGGGVKPHPPQGAIWRRDLVPGPNKLRMILFRAGYCQLIEYPSS